MLNCKIEKVIKFGQKFMTTISKFFFKGLGPAESLFKNRAK